MNKKLILITLAAVLLLIANATVAQVTTSPEFPVETNKVTITFDATKGTGGLKDFTGDVYAHTGVITDKSTGTSDWKYVKTNWGVNTAETKLTRVSTNTYTLEITPTIRDYYGVPAGEKVEKLAFVFRSADSTKEGKATGGADIFVDVHEEGLVVDIVNPSEDVLAAKNESIPVSVTTSAAADIELLLNNTSLKNINGTELTHTLTIANAGGYWLKAVATQGETAAKDSVFITVRKDVITETIPAGLVDGINYDDDPTTVELVLYAPGKEYVYVLGDFNNWVTSNSYQMNKDGDRFWITLTNLEAGKEYVFQYFVDGELRIGDPYADKVSDPWDDQYITDAVYP